MRWNKSITYNIWNICIIFLISRTSFYEFDRIFKFNLNMTLQYSQVMLYRNALMQTLYFNFITSKNFFCLFYTWNFDYTIVQVFCMWCHVLYVSLVENSLSFLFVLQPILLSNGFFHNFSCLSLKLKNKSILNM